MTNRLLDTNAESQGAACEGMEDVHKVSIIRGEAFVFMFALKVWTSWVQTCRCGQETRDKRQETRDSYGQNK